jgi:hypothetical protein
MDAGTYVYPWDVVGDPAAAERIAALGVGHATVAAFYHATRALTPRHPGHRVVVAERPDIAGVEFEAAGWYGFDHLNQHDKVAGIPLSEDEQFLFSLCFCPACCGATPRPRVSLANTGLDMATLPTGTTGVVVNCWNGSPALVEASVGHGVDVYAGLLGVGGMGADPERLSQVIADVRAAGAAGVRIYHAGLAGGGDLAAIRKASADA